MKTPTSTHAATEAPESTRGRGVAPARWHFDQPIEPLRAMLERGGVLAIPTESSYGLAVDPRSAAGVAAVFALKVRAAGKALPVVLADVAQASVLGVAADDRGLQLGSRYWPAALSVLVAPNRVLPAMANEQTLAVRVPAHAGLRRLLAAIGHPLTATSANVEGESPICQPSQLEAWLAGRDDVVIVDGGLLPGGAPSTLVTCEEESAHSRAAQPKNKPYRVLRAGRFPLD